MKVYDSLESFERLDNAIVTSGTFDGVHLGHQKILKKLVSIAKRDSGESVLITFWPHPRIVLGKEKELFLINSFDEKTRLIESFGVDHLVKIKFTKEFSQLSSLDFVNKVLVESLGTRKLIMGYNHRFGKNREGGFNFLKDNSRKFGFEVVEIPKQEIDDIGVSSTEVRKFISTGNFEKASALMGHHYTISGTVVQGDKIGRSIGFPTANILLDSTNKLLPSDGVYAVKVNLENCSKNGMLYIGDRPTIEGKLKNIEVNIFDFNRDIYGESISVEVISKLRGDIKFNNLSELKKQLSKDQKETLKTFHYENRKS